MTDLRAWTAPDPILQDLVREHSEAALDVYRRKQELLREHANHEDSLRMGGYAERQLLELVQNSADAISRSGSSGRIELRIERGILYCANEGDPFDDSGVTALAHAFLSDKRGDEIGRFGLGFKSVLSITDRPQVLSRSVSFEFNSDQSQAALREIAGANGRLPQLRVPTVIDPNLVFEADAVARDLAEWATTIVRLPLARHRDRLIDQIAKFDTEFLVFANSVSELHLIVRGEGEQDLDQAHRCQRLGDDTVQIATPGGVSSEWLVVDRMHKPSLSAREEVGEAVARSSFKITYAAPLRGARGRGSFWAYFPLRDITTATGIFNAPWRVNDDRTTLLEGRYNNEIFELFAKMMVATLPRLRTPEDPAMHFDYMPSRAKEILSIGDEYLSRKVPALAAAAGLVPDTSGALRSPEELLPLDHSITLPEELMKVWQGSRVTRGDAPHFKCYSTRERRARLKELFENGPRRLEGEPSVVGVATWLSALGSRDDFESCARGLAILTAIPDRETLTQAARARIIPTTSGMASVADHDHVFLRGEIISDTAEFELVDPGFLSSREEIERDLVRLGFKEVAADLELSTLLRTADESWSDARWESVWNLIDHVSLTRAQAIVADYVQSGGLMRIRTVSGLWRPADEVVDGTQAGIMLDDETRMLDSDFHGNRMSSAAGVIVGVNADYPVVEEELFAEYKAWARVEFNAQRAIDPSTTLVSGIFGEDRGAGPIGMLRSLWDSNDTAGRAIWSKRLLETDARLDWPMYPPGAPTEKALFPAPHLWAISRYGLIDTTWGPRKPELCLHPSAFAVHAYLPVAINPSASKLRLTREYRELPLVVWREFLTRAIDAPIRSGTDIQGLTDLVSAAVDALPPGEEVQALPAIVVDRAKICPSESVIVAGDDAHVEYLATKGLPFLHIPDPVVADRVIGRARCKRAEDEIVFGLSIDGPSDPVQAVDQYLGLRSLGLAELRDVELIRCERIARRVTTPGGVEDTPMPSLRRGSTLYVENSAGDLDVIGAMNAAFGLGLSSRRMEDLLNESVEIEIEQTMERARSAESEVARLSILMSDDELEARLPQGLLRALRATAGTSAAASIASIFLDVYGFDALKELKEDLAAKRFPAPDVWSGSAAAVRFVKRLGFPRAYAGERSEGLEQTFTIPGRPELSNLHRYQEDILEEIHDVLTSPRGAAEKAMLSLPTGAGKTRVTVESVVRLFLEGQLEGPVLWIAQSEELCEQAVQTWALVWRDFADKRPLMIGRLWGGHEVAEPDNELSVIVATDAKLDVIKKKFEYEWLADASAVIIDEAHVAGDSPLYTRILTWLGVDGRSSERPLLGLTATAFKGHSTQRTEQLVRRFGRRRINVLGDDPYETLREMGVLARVRHEKLEGTALRLSESELDDLQRYQRLTSTVLQRVAMDEARTIRLVDHIANQDPSWPVLVFTSSVLSAQIVAAMLRARDIPSAAVSGKTRRHERRRIIREFKDGQIRVLTNCDVLTQGFDAPGVKALYIARPTFSPNAYIQMVGRGLRGPLNGGKDECLIVDFEDTFANFSDGQLAFKEFDYLWESRARV